MTTWKASFRANVGAFQLDVDIEAGPGPLAIVGQNGSGKTTFLRALVGAVPVEKAEIVVADEVWASTTRNIHLPMERRRVGYVPQGYGLFPHLSVLDNVSFGLSTGPHRCPRPERHQKAQALLEDLDAAPLIHRPVSGLSGGEKQRVALARALVINPVLLLLDEPLAALDVTTRRVVRSFLAERLQAFGGPSVIVTHDIRDVVALGATVSCLERGRIVQTGTLEHLRAAPASDFIAELVGAEPPARPK